MLSGKISISRVNSSHEPYSWLSIVVRDNESMEQFVEIQVTLEDFAKAVTGQAGIPVEFETRGLEHIGMQKELDTLRFMVESGNYTTDQLKTIACAELRKFNQGFPDDPWESHIRLNSQDSVTYSGGETWVKINIHRWVEQDV